MKYLFAGDIALGDHPKSVGFGFYSKYRDGIPVELASSIFPSAVEADIRFGNLEFVLDDIGSAPITFENSACRGDIGFIKGIAAARFSAMNLANNHIYQYGRGPFDMTRVGLETAGIVACGTSKDLEGESVVEVNGSRMIFVAWSNRPRQYSSDSPPYNELSMPECFETVKRLSRLGCDICVSLHWGEEFVLVPNCLERDIARRLIDSGATIVVGHHPHVVRPIERYAHGLIAYSLGNLVGDMVWDRRIVETGCLFVETDCQRVVDWRFHEAEIGANYFPSYSGRQLTDSDMLGSDSTSAGPAPEDARYSIKARVALAKHQYRTAGHMIRNFRKYPEGFVKRILVQAVKDRLAG